MHTLSHAGFTVFLRNGCERNWNRYVGVEAFFVHQTVEPLLVENVLHFRKHGFDRVELGTVGYIEDRFDVELLINGPHYFRLVHLQLIHKNS